MIVVYTDDTDFAGDYTVQFEYFSSKATDNTVFSEPFTISLINECNPPADWPNQPVLMPVDIEGDHTVPIGYWYP
jgi:hypothetical protein